MTLVLESYWPASVAGSKPLGGGVVTWKSQNPYSSPLTNPYPPVNGQQTYAGEADWILAYPTGSYDGTTDRSCWVRVWDGEATNVTWAGAIGDAPFNAQNPANFNWNLGYPLRRLNTLFSTVAEATSIPLTRCCS